jgi:NAD+ synthase (glutamine-hydrolysing)
MAGGVAVLGDLLKTDVYRLSKLINSSAGREVIPPRTISRVPTAELRPDQTDQDTLPPYDTLDAILEQYLEQGRSVGEMVARGLDYHVVQRVVSMVAAAEHKRRQAPVVLRVSPRAFGTGWRMPVAAKRVT